jgi:hypothetical protein
VLVSDDPAVPVAYRSREAIDFYLQPIPDGIWENEVTVRSTRAARMYEPGAWIARVSPTSLLMVVAAEDRVTVSDVALGAYKRALEPKRLTLISGGHFDPYRFASWLYRMAPFWLGDCRPDQPTLSVFAVLRCLTLSNREPC